MTDNNTAKKNISFKLIFVIIILGCFVGIFLRTLMHHETSEKKQLDKEIPEFSLPNLLNSSEFITQEDLKQDTPLLVNIWASWCAPCRNEHKMLTKLATEHNIKVFGLNYKDKRENGQKFLEHHGNPFFKVVNDSEGLTTLNWGIRGVPETFVINKDHKIIYRHTGEIREKDLEMLIEKVQGNK